MLGSVNLLVSREVILLVGSRFRKAVFTASDTVTGLLFMILGFYYTLYGSMLSVRGASVVPRMQIPFDAASWGMSVFLGWWKGMVTLFSTDTF